MNSSRSRLREAREIFLDLADRPASERKELLDELARSDAELSDLVKSLLVADARASGLFDEGLERLAPELLQEMAGAEVFETEAEGRQIGPYRILTLLGRGGMGEVYLVERTDGEFEQRVALKLLRRGADSETVRKRFLRERQVLAHLEHPHIARLLDGGTEEGRPYFVLEHVEGVPISEYCRRHATAIEDRIRLIATCCDAVEAAHRSLVVHRDLKPSNILVTEAGEVKLLDFGIAKLLADAEDESRLTRVEDRVLTPSYAAPEQITGEPVTTATDVYALGVVLYELLTGRLPSERGGTAAELASRVEKETIERPSRAVEHEPEELLANAGFSDSDRGRLSGRLRGDLDSILLKALRREPERRYASAAALGEDLRRHLEGRPVSARPDTLGYRAGKFARRHRAGVAAAALVVLALVGGLAATAWQARRAHANAREARAQTQRAERVKGFLISIFRRSDPGDSLGETITARQILDEGMRKIETELSAEPAVRAELDDAAARIYRSLGVLEPAKKLAERSIAYRRGLEAGHEDQSERIRRRELGASLATLAEILYSSGDLDGAGARGREAAALAAEDIESREVRIRASMVEGEVSSQLGEAEKALAAFDLAASLSRQSFGEDSAEAANAVQGRGMALTILGRLDEAERSFRQAMQLLESVHGPRHPAVASAAVNLADLLDRRNQLDESEALLRRALDIHRSTQGEEHVSVADVRTKYGFLLIRRRLYSAAREELQKALSIFERLDHFDAGSCLRYLGQVDLSEERYQDAAEHFRRAEQFLARKLGEDAYLVWIARGNLAYAQQQLGRLAEAEALQRRVLERLSQLQGPDSDEVRAPLKQLGETLRRRGHPEEAEALHRRARALELKLFGTSKHPGVAATDYQLALDLEALGGKERLVEATGLMDEAIGTLRKKDAEHPRVGEYLLAAGRIASKLGDHDKSRMLLTEARDRLRRDHGTKDPRTLEAARRLASL